VVGKWESHHLLCTFLAHVIALQDYPSKRNIVDESVNTTAGKTKCVRVLKEMKYVQ
jgi:hypothetical protein